MKNKKPLLVVVVILIIVGSIIIVRNAPSENLTGKLNLPKSASVKTVKDKKVASSLQKNISLQVIFSKPSPSSMLQSNYKSILSGLSTAKKKQVKIQSYNAAVANINGYKDMLISLVAAVNESTGPESSVRLQVLQSAEEADNKLAELLSHLTNNFGNSAGDLLDPVFEDDFLEPIIFDFLDMVVIPPELFDIDLTQIMNDLQNLDDFLMSIGMLNFEISSVVLGYGSASFYNSNGEFVGSAPIASAPKKSGGSTLVFDGDFTCHHSSCGGDGQKWRQDKKDGKWKKATFCADCGWGTLLNTNPNEFVEDVLLSNPVNLNAWLSALQNLNAALDNYFIQTDIQ